MRMLFKLILGNPVQAVTFAAVMLLVGLLGYYKAKNASLEREADRLALSLVNSEARSATTIHLNDSLAARLALQEEIVREQSDEIAGLEEVMASTEVVVTIDTVALDEEVIASVEDDVRKIEIDFYREPIRIFGTVALPPPPLPGRVDLYAAVDLIALKVRVGCRETQIRAQAALVTVKGPPWAKLGIPSIITDPNVCNRPLVERAGPFNIDPKELLFVPASALAGGLAALAAEGDFISGALVGTGVGMLFTMVF